MEKRRLCFLTEFIAQNDIKAQPDPLSGTPSPTPGCSNPPGHCQGCRDSSCGPRDLCPSCRAGLRAHLGSGAGTGGTGPSPRWRRRRPGASAAWLSAPSWGTASGHCSAWLQHTAQSCIPHNLPASGAGNNPWKLQLKKKKISLCHRLLCNKIRLVRSIILLERLKKRLKLLEVNLRVLSHSFPQDLFFHTLLKPEFEGTAHQSKVCRVFAKVSSWESCSHLDNSKLEQNVNVGSQQRHLYSKTSSGVF